MRFALTALLWLFSTVALAVAVPTAWAQTHVVDVNGYTAMARTAAGDPALQTAVASELASRAMALITQRGYHVRVPETVRIPVAVSTQKALQPGELRPLAIWGPWVSVGAAVLTGICALLALAAARSRGRVLAGLGISALLVGASGWAAIELARRRINDTLNNTTGNIRRIADVMVGQAESSLHHWLDVTLAAGGVLVVLGVLVAALGSLRKI